MKKTGIFFLAPALVLCSSLVSCGPSAEEESEQVVKQLFSYINESETDSIENVFPSFDSGDFRIIDSDSIKIKQIVKDEENKDLYKVSLVNYYSATNDDDDIDETDVTLWTKKGEKKYYITESVGLIDRGSLPYYVRACGALKSGGEELKDTDVLKRAVISKEVMKEKAEEIAKEMSGKLQVNSHNTPAVYADIHHTYLRVKNNSPYAISHFTVKVNYYDTTDNGSMNPIVRSFDHYLPAFTNSSSLTLTWPWKELSRTKSSARLKLRSATVTVTAEDLINGASEFYFDGTEYKKYVKTHKAELEEDDEDDDDDD